VIEASRNVGELIEEISRASSEQAQGIMQINQAISEMNDVVQKTAAISEEAASSAEETSAQAAELTRVVYDIITLVENRKKADEYLRNARMKHPRSTTGHRAEKPVRKQIPHSTTF
jgi:methyl-accepting chemotaxis protein